MRFVTLGGRFAQSLSDAHTHAVKGTKANHAETTILVQRIQSSAVISIPTPPLIKEEHCWCNGRVDKRVRPPSPTLGHPAGLSVPLTSSLSWTNEDGGLFQFLDVFFQTFELRLHLLLAA